MLITKEANRYFVVLKIPDQVLVSVLSLPFFGENLELQLSSSFFFFFLFFKKKKNHLSLLICFLSGIVHYAFAM